MSNPTRILRMPEVERRVGLKRSRITELEAAGAFPRRIKIAGGRAAGFIEAEIEAWLQERIAASRSGRKPASPGVSLRRGA